MNPTHPFKTLLLLLTPLFFQCGSAENKDTQSYVENGLRYHPAPHVPFESLKLEEVDGWRKRLVKEALKVRAESSWPRYVFGSASPEKGGFDCSGAMYYVLQREGFTPARTSANQYLWLLDKGEIHKVSASATAIDHPDYKHLQSGDLVFWSGTYEPTDSRTVPITHVGMYLGYMEGYAKPIMICSSKGRSFNGVRCDGYGVFDFKIPSASSRAKIVGYGSVK